MKYLLKKILCFFVCFSFISSNLNIYAEEISAGDQSVLNEEVKITNKEVDLNQNIDCSENSLKSTIPNNSNELNSDYQNLKDEEKSIINESAHDTQSNLKLINVSDKALVNYFLIESPYLETPSTQNFVLSFGDGTQNIKSMSLFYQKDGLEEVELSSSVQQGKLFKFSQSFNNEDSVKYFV